MSQVGYYSSPEIYENKLYFISDDDIWLQDLSDVSRPATRVTAEKGNITSLKISPDGEYLAYTSTLSGGRDIYLMPKDGGIPTRLTYSQGMKVIGWKDDQTILCTSSHEHFTRRETLIYELDIHSKKLSAKNLGPATFFEESVNTQVLGKNNGDPARWKRYRGGTAGTIWIKSGERPFKQILKKIPTNLTCPKIIGERVFFVSDHEGIGNIYSVNMKGTNLKRHTHQSEFYVRSFSHFQGIIVFTANARIHSHNLMTNETFSLDIKINSQFLQARERFVSAEDYLQDFDIFKDAQKLSISARGKLFVVPPWGGAPIRLGDQASRYKLPRVALLKEKEILCSLKLDHENEEHLIYFDLATQKETSVLEKQDWGKVFELVPNPTQPLIALANNRNELFIIDLEKKNTQKIDQSSGDHIGDLSWSKDGQLLCYVKKESESEQLIKVYDSKSKKTHRTIKNVLADTSPTFSDCGKYLYFIGSREFNPCGSEFIFQYGFPFLAKVYAITLAEKTSSPLQLFKNFEVEKEEEDEKSKNKEEIKIDWNTLEDRIESLPFSQGGHRKLFTYKDQIISLKALVGPNDPNSTRWDNSSYELVSYSLKEKKVKTLLTQVSPERIQVRGKYLICETEEELRIINLEVKPSEEEDYNKTDGWVDLTRLKVKFSPRPEWKQMYREAWILQREHFWVSDMSKIDWADVYLKYLPLLERINTRSEFSDLIWEMQGELGTSHAYEFGGEYPNLGHPYSSGLLGATFTFNSKNKSFIIAEILRGDSWLEGHHSPLVKPGVSLNIGDQIYSVDGESFQDEISLSLHLENKCNTNISLEILRKGAKKKEILEVRTSEDDVTIRYRQWVNSNREYVKKKSNGKLGYLHIPDMSLKGMSEFWRAYSLESECEGLVIDVRYNGGGSVSQLLLKELQQKVLAFNTSRWFGESHYPIYSVNGPLVCITNEHAGSDGDIFSHSFKMLHLGKLIGKRTWGGVIGIWPRHSLSDFSLTSQPEFSFWFNDVGFDVENYGTDPDIEIDITPDDWAHGRDPQLDKAIEVVLKEHKRTPSIKPNFSKKPNLKAPKLPKGY
ncbi:S41 family peptidase [Halobacteriovorax sp. JY17]|uniref:S41 family peptidase n=1 Tax=Halobacteriovorax sp. JY17 TaxID=2014617 RepID=UPI000C3ED613|nr:S41 family peptidase [Halobacteriovorax sp. JY17]PIK16320.1 MAG: hypothetical protein CES88_06155 [Halobacteriovorax sp. JY17]